MQTILGIVTIAIGLLMLLGGLTKSDFVVYRLLVSRSRPLWGNKVHVFYCVTGVLVCVMGVLYAFGFFAL